MHSQLMDSSKTGLKETSVGVFVPSLVGGGAERVALNLAEGFVKQGLRVDLIITTSVGAFMSKVPAGVRLIELKVKDVRSRATWHKLFALIRYLKQERPTVLISIIDQANVATLAQRLSGVSTRVIIGVHNTLSLESKGIKGKLKPYLIRLSYPWASSVVAVSQGVAEDLARMSGLPLKSIRVIYNPVVTPEMLEKAKELIDHPWFAPGEPPVILGAGRLVDQKDFPTLIKAFALVRQRQLARLMIIGEGVRRPQLEELIAKLGLESDVALVGFVENSYAYLSKSTVFALSSAWEGLPTVLIEAMAIGTPVVSTDCKSGPMEILGQGKYGSLVPVGDSNALAEAILQVLAGESKQVESRWVDQFSLAASTQQYFDLAMSL